jgi:hypothetical protein
MSGTLPVHRLLYGITESSAAGAPVKSSFAFFVSGLLQGVEWWGIVDHGSDAGAERTCGRQGAPTLLSRCPPIRHIFPPFYTISFCQI